MKNNQSWMGGPTPQRTADNCTVKYNSLVHYCKLRPQRIEDKAYEFVEVDDPVDTDGEDIVGMRWPPTARPRRREGPRVVKGIKI